MRKLLLASAVTLGGFLGVSGPASAQLATFSENPNAPMPPPTQWSRSGAFGFVQNTPPIPAPGTAVVRISGYIVEYMGVTGGQSRANEASPTGSPGVGGSKLGNPTFFGYIRLYPSLEGVAANGLKYGAFAEIRQDSGIGTGAGGGAFGSISGQDPARGNLYWRRAFVYFGEDQIGTFRLGAADQPTSLFLTGTAENFDNGGWNGDAPAIIPNNLGVTWPFPDVGNLYTTQKAVYLSPQFFGFDFGVSYEPNTSSIFGGSLTCGTTDLQNLTSPGAGFNGNAGPGCANLSSTGSADVTRRRNTFDGVLRYRGSFGPVGVAVTVGGISSGKVNNSDTAPFPSGVFQRTGLEVGDFGAQVTYGGLALQAHADVGTFNPNSQWANLPIKGESQGDAWVVGASYTIGPLVFGGSWFETNGAGNQTPANRPVGVGTLTELGAAAGATYSVTPGFGFTASYIWGQRKQNDFDLINSISGSPLHNKTDVQAGIVGAYVKW
ncbi:MAG TPA: hypothetical protein VHY76_12485 [Acetobacteraceae bacterium]|nr:hypothetical protein [Acetobacteraceae bacterium]